MIIIQNPNPEGPCDYIRLAQEALKGKWMLCAGIYFILTAIPVLIDLRFKQFVGFQSIVFSFANLINLLTAINLCRFYLEIAKGEEARVQILWDFKSIQYFWKGIMIIVLFYIGTIIGFLLLILPAYYFIFTYSQVFFIFIENPSLPITQIFSQSHKMMRGNRCNLFQLAVVLSLCLFAGLLCLIIGFFFVVSLVYTVFAIFYLKKKLPQNEEEMTQEVN